MTLAPRSAAVLKPPAPFSSTFRPALRETPLTTFAQPS